MATNARIFYMGNLGDRALGEVFTSSNYLVANATINNSTKQMLCRTERLVNSHEFMNKFSFVYSWLSFILYFLRVAVIGNE